MPINLAPARRHQILNNVTVTTSGNSGTLPNLGRGLNPIAILVLDIQGPVTGTTPSMTVTISAAIDGGRMVPIFNFAAQTGVIAVPLRQVITNLLETNLQVSWAVTGTTPSFGAVSIDLFFSPPDA